MRLGDIEFGKLQFLAEFQIMRNKTFIEAAICSAWKKTGLIPFNLEIGSRILEYRICNLRALLPRHQSLFQILFLIVYHIAPKKLLIKECYFNAGSYVTGYRLVLYHVRRRSTSRKELCNQSLLGLLVAFSFFCPPQALSLQSLHDLVASPLHHPDFKKNINLKNGPPNQTPAWTADSRVR